MQLGIRRAFVSGVCRRLPLAALVFLQVDSKAHCMLRPH